MLLMSLLANNRIFFEKLRERKQNEANQRGLNLRWRPGCASKARAEDDVVRIDHPNVQVWLRYRRAQHVENLVLRAPNKCERRSDYSHSERKLCGFLFPLRARA